jgi:type I restriction enzyme M protein
LTPDDTNGKEPMPMLSLAKVERHLYSAADRLRQEGLDAATYKDYIFGMLFLKRPHRLRAVLHQRLPLVLGQFDHGRPPFRDARSRQTILE